MEQEIRFRDASPEVQEEIMADRIAMPPPQFIPRRSARISAQSTPQSSISMPPPVIPLPQSWQRPVEVNQHPGRGRRGCWQQHKGLGCGAISANHAPKQYNTLRPVIQ